MSFNESRASVITEFSICKNVTTGDFNFDGLLNILDVTSLVNYILNQSNEYCSIVYGDFDTNEELNVIDVIYLVNTILGN